jgi:hypothetical protein
MLEGYPKEKNIEKAFANAEAGRPCESCAEKKFHLIIHTDSIKKSDVNTFQNAALVLFRDYQKHYGPSKHETKRVFVKTGQEIVETIKNHPVGSIVSIDVVSHGNQGGVHISKKLKKPIESGIIQKRAHVQMRKHDKPQTEEDAEFIEESMHGLYSLKKLVSYYYNQTYEKKEDDQGKQVDNDDCADLGDIDFDRFADGAFAEFHGCRVAEHLDVWNHMFDNFAEDFSENLSSTSVTVGHIVNNFPDGHPVNSNDYRHNKVRCYQDGDLLDGKDAVERWGLKFTNSSTPP